MRTQVQQNQVAHETDKALFTMGFIIVSIVIVIHVFVPLKEELDYLLGFGMIWPGAALVRMLFR